MVTFVGECPSQYNSRNNRKTLLRRNLRKFLFWIVFTIILLLLNIISVFKEQFPIQVVINSTETTDISFVIINRGNLKSIIFMSFASLLRNKKKSQLAEPIE